LPIRQARGLQLPENTLLGVGKLPHTKRARSYEVFGSLDPQFAAAGNRAAATEAVKRLRAFKAQYVRALAAWTAGDRNASFPQGTWWMRVCHGARCGPGP